MHGGDSLRSVMLLYLLAFGISWLVEVPQAAAAAGLLNVEFPGVVGFLAPLSPMLAAVLLSARAGGIARISQLLGRLLRWRVAPMWYVVVLFMFPALALVAVGITFVATGGAPDFTNSYVRSVFPQFPTSLSPWLLLPPFLLFSIVTSIPEEVGWRGYALPRLQERLGATSASLAVGALWGLWHLPLFFNPQAAQGGISFPLFLAGTLVTSILFTWVFNGTGGSLLMVSMLHSSFNASNVFLPLLPQVTGSALQLDLFLVVIGAVAVGLAVFGRLRPDQSLRSERPPDSLR